MKISKILSKYDTDKNTCERRGHCYGKAYDGIFRSFDRTTKLDLIEIGIENGASLLVWREFFPNASITGVDIKDMVENKHPDVEYIIEDVKNMSPEQEYDIVIDDGSHKLKDVVHTVRNFKLKEGGVMVIEDAQAPEHWFQKIRKETKYTIELIDLRGLWNPRDDFLIVLRNYGYNL